MEDMIYWIWLSILNLKPIEKIKLINYYKTPKKIYNARFNKNKSITNNEKISSLLFNTQKIKEAEEVLRYCLKNNISIIKYTDFQFPERLKNIYDYPILIYAKGNIGLLNSKNIISIIGTRNCSEYGKNITDKFSYLLSENDYTIVSGMARGIDSYAHIGSIKSTGKTIAVLGSGVDYIYPKENRSLYMKILKNNGLIISEYSPKTRPIPYFFPMRNRIISGISDKILITEAGKKSGSIITANIAIEQGKDVYAIPGNITNKYSEGTNELLKDGAILVTSIEDIINL